MGPSSLPPLGWHAFLTGWTLSAGWTVLTLVLALGYLAALRQARRTTGQRVVHASRVASYLAGVALLLVTVTSSVEVYSRALFWMHMVSHLTLIMVVPALLVAGSPLTVLKAAYPGGAVARALSSRAMRVLSHPVVGLLQYAAVLVLTHLTGFMDQIMLHPWLGAAEHVLYVVSGFVFFLPLIGQEPVPTRLPRLMRIFLLVVGMTPDTIVGIVLLQTGRPLYPVMAQMAPGWAPGAVRDLNLGGAIMWAVGDGIMMVLAVVLVFALIADPQRDQALGSWLEKVRRQSLRDRAGDSGAALAEDTDVDNDDAALAAYNEMLGRLGR